MSGFLLHNLIIKMSSCILNIIFPSFHFFYPLGGKYNNPNIFLFFEKLIFILKFNKFLNGESSAKAFYDFINSVYESLQFTYTNSKINQFHEKQLFRTYKRTNTRSFLFPLFHFAQIAIKQTTFLFFFNLHLKSIAVSLIFQNIG